MKAWYFSIEKIKDKLLEKNKEINWVPQHANDGRFTPWITNARDWNISRNRYWSTPIPVWKCNSCENVRVFGGRAEIEQASGVKLKGLHRQYIDDVTVKCGCGDIMQRIPEVLDCWFESASVPYASKHYRTDWLETLAKWTPRNDVYKQSDFIVEYAGQIRCWFYVLHVLSVALFDEPAFKNCVVHGTILASDGKKLSKSSKNYTDPMELMETLGTDAYRLYLFRSNAMIIGDLMFDQNGIKEQIQKILLPLYNCASFFSSYAELDKVSCTDAPPEKPTNSLDKWILAKLFQAEKHISSNMATYQIDEYVQPIVDLIDGFSTWYLRRSRRRFWAKEMTQDKMDAYQTTYYVLTSLCKMLAPAAPVLSEKLYKHLTGEHSVHLAAWSIIPKKFKNDKVLAETDVIMRVITLARHLRERENIKLRQPLQLLEVAFANAKDSAILKKFKSIVLEEINVKEITILKDVSDMATVEYLPNFATLKKYGAQLKDITVAIKGKQFKRIDNSFEVVIADQTIALAKEDILTRYTAKQGLVESDHDIVVRLDTALTEDLRQEGMAREIIRNIQDGRKQCSCEIMDKIQIELIGDVPTAWIDYICDETLGRLAKIENPDLVCEVCSNDKKVIAKIKR